MFFIILAADIVGIIADIRILQTLAKPVLMPVLLSYYFSETGNIQDSLKKWIFLALFFSWAGDVLLMLQGTDEIFFLLGLSAFLIAHIFYCLYFHQIKTKEKIKSHPWTLILVVLYYSTLMFLLSQYLGEMKIPVRVYGMVISFMLLLAMHMFYQRDNLAGKLMLTGALLFVISDSVLAIDKFYHSFEPAGVLIMITYGLAQWLITTGAIRYAKFGQHTQLHSA